MPYGLSQQLRAAVASTSGGGTRRRARCGAARSGSRRGGGRAPRSSKRRTTSRGCAPLRGRAQAVGELQAQLAAARAELEEVEGGAAARVQGRHAALKLASERRREIEQASAAAKLKAQLEIDQKSHRSRRRCARSRS